MANNQSFLTVNTIIPPEDIMPDEMALLSAVFELDDEATDIYSGQSGVYFFNETGIYDGMIADFSAVLDKMPPEDQRDKWQKEIAKIAEVSDAYGDQELTDYYLVFAALQRIVARSSTINYIEIATAYTCDKMRAHEFGGTAILITADQILTMGTSQWVEETVKKLGLSHPKPDRESALPSP